MYNAFDNVDVFLLPGKDYAQPFPPDFKQPSYASVCDVITAKDGPLADWLGRVNSKQYHDDCIYDMVMMANRNQPVTSSVTMWKSVREKEAV